jgi:hypothetical protein
MKIDSESISRLDFTNNTTQLEKVHGASLRSSQFAGEVAKETLGGVVHKKNIVDGRPTVKREASIFFIIIV